MKMIYTSLLALEYIQVGLNKIFDYLSLVTYKHDKGFSIKIMR